MLYTFDQIFAADPASPERVASDGVVTIFAPGDATQAPIAIKTVDGLTITNPVRVNDAGYGPAFTHDTLDRVAWSGGGFSGFFTSYDGMKNEAVAARTSAQEAAAFAEEAVANTSVPTAEAVRRELATEGGMANQAVKDLVAVAAGGFALKPDNGGKPVGKGELVLNVLDYGVKGDGVTDDTAALQAVFNEAARAGAIVDFGSSERSYYVAGVVEIGSNTTIQGRGAQLIKKTNAGESSYAIFCTRSHGQAWYGAGGSGIRFNNIHFRGVLPGRPACAFSGHHSNDVQFNGCTFEQMGGTGHIVDLSGCQDVVFRDCRFLGAADVNSRAEAIQVDISAAAGISVLDDSPGSYSGLPTRRVTVDNCKFLPITVGGVTYPAPVPFGSHAQWEGRWFEDLSFINNTVIDGRLHTGTSPVGLLHFSCVDGLTIRNNTFVNTLGSVGRVVSATQAESGVGKSVDPSASSQTMVTFSQPMRSKNISVSDNTFRGFASPDHDAIYVDGCDSVSVTANKLSGCGSLYDIRNTVGFTAHSNQFTSPPVRVAPQIVNLNKVTNMTMAAEVIDVTGATNVTDIILISNLSKAGSVSGNVIIGKGESGVNQFTGSSIAVGANVLV